MSQHFLLSAKARTLSVRKVMEMTHDQAFQVFRELRWGVGEETACPVCGTIDRHYFRNDRKQWRCKACTHAFSVTSGTIFANHKLPLRVYLLAIAIYTNAVKGISALQLGRDLGVQYKTAFVLAHKIRESLMEQRDDAPLSGEVHMDGAYVNGYVRPENKKEDRIDRRLFENQRPDKRCVFVMRQKVEAAGDEIRGSNKTLTFIIKAENRKRSTNCNLFKGFLSKQPATLMFEVLHPEDPHIIHYGPEMMGLHLIGGRNLEENAPHWTESRLDEVAAQIGLRRPQWREMRYGDALQSVQTLKHEGYLNLPTVFRQWVLRANPSGSPGSRFAATASRPRPMASSLLQTTRSDGASTVILPEGSIFAGSERSHPVCSSTGF